MKKTITILILSMALLLIGCNSTEASNKANSIYIPEKIVTLNSTETESDGSPSATLEIFASNTCAIHTKDTDYYGCYGFNFGRGSILTHTDSSGITTTLEHGSNLFVFADLLDNSNQTFNLQDFLDGATQQKYPYDVLHRIILLHGEDGDFTYYAQSVSNCMKLTEGSPSLTFTDDQKKFVSGKSKQVSCVDSDGNNMILNLKFKGINALEQYVYEYTVKSN